MSDNKQIRYPKSFSKLLLQITNQVITANGENWINLPGWFKLSEDPRVMEHYSDEDIPDNLKDAIIRANYLQLRSDKIILLEAFALFLEKEGYMDTDWRVEEPFAIDEFLKE